MASFNFTPGDDLFVSGQNVLSSDYLEALAGNDTVSAGGGDDYIFAGPGNDLIHGDNGDDQIFTQGGKDSVFGDAGNDTITVDPDGQAVLVDGGTGWDKLSLDLPAKWPPPAITATAITGGFRLDGLGITALGVEVVRIATLGRLNFTGGAEVDEAFAVTGSRVSLGAGDDTMYLSLAAKGSGSVLTGGTGGDVLFIDGRMAVAGITVTVDAANLGHIKTGATWAGTFAEFEIMHVDGTNFGDTVNITGKAIALSFGGFRGAGNDRVNGSWGGDDISTNGGNDTLNGWGGDDYLRGGTGADLLTGGANRDTFQFAPGDSNPGAWDTITDFRTASAFSIQTDSIDLRDFGGLTFIGQAGFTADRQAHARAHDGAVWVEVNTGGTLDADFVLKLANLTDASLITAAHFQF